ncbi:hypothetical protein HJG60_009690 [Phyllostomus discolor]|uniref:Uncharacterized protein n=1 Tax=Phyllostomus discolor TaxID=89673 RepID=A0A834EQ54_9CHIR|nr:hypothetical protein HJG60_009690 [Phyllostomus discolor]
MSRAVPGCSSPGTPAPLHLPGTDVALGPRAHTLRTVEPPGGRSSSEFRRRRLRLPSIGPAPSPSPLPPFPAGFSGNDVPPSAGRLPGDGVKQSSPREKGVKVGVGLGGAPGVLFTFPAESEPQKRLFRDGSMCIKISLKQLVG